MKLSDMYSYIIANWLNGGNFVTKSKMLATDIKPEYNYVFTKDYVKKVYRIVGIKPENEDIGFIDYIRDEMFYGCPEVEVIINIHNNPVTMNINSEKFIRAMSKASDNYNTYKEVFDSQEGIAKLTGKTYKLPNGARIKLSKERLDNLYQIFLSYYKIHTKVSAGGTLALTEIFIEVCAKNRRDARLAGSKLQGLLGALDIRCDEVKGVLKAYMKEFGTAVPPAMKLNKKFLPQLLFTDDNSAAFSSYRSRGLVGGKNLLLGKDYYSNLPFIIDIFSAPSAQVFLLMGKTGSGKTYTAFATALSALAMGEHVTAVDIKGREWVSITPFVNHKILTFDEKNPSFVNTLRLDDLVINKDNATELFNVAVKGTVALLQLIVNLEESEGNISDLELILREAVLKLYSQHGIDPANPSSFKDSKYLNYTQLLPIIENLSSTATYTSSQKKMVSLARSRCYAYIGDSGLFADAFRNEITLGDILNTPLIIYEFNKNQNAMTDSLDVLRIFMVQFLDSKKKSMLKSQDKFLFCFYEELQRCEQFGNLLEYICGDVTGSRSNNAVVFLLMNSLKVLQGNRAQDIRSNITSFIVGRVEPNDIHSMEEDFNQMWLASQLRLFSDHVSTYRNCFAASIDTGTEELQAVYKVELPESMSKKFKTRTTKEG